VGLNVCSNPGMLKGGFHTDWTGVGQKDREESTPQEKQEEIFVSKGRGLVKGRRRPSKNVERREGLCLVWFWGKKDRGT